MRKIGAVATGILTIVVVLAAGAWACTNLATLNLSSSAGRAGIPVTVTGTAFATTGCPPVVIRWDRLDGPVLAIAPSDPLGTIHASVVIPAGAQAGLHLLIATQEECTDDRGVTEPTSGTPARATFMVEAPPFEVSASATAAPSVAAAAGSGSGGLLVSAISLALALALGQRRPRRAGFTGFTRQGRRPPCPPPSRSPDARAALRYRLTPLGGWLRGGDSVTTDG